VQCSGQLSCACVRHGARCCRPFEKVTSAACKYGSAPGLTLGAACARAVEGANSGPRPYRPCARGRMHARACGRGGRGRGWGQGRTSAALSVSAVMPGMQLTRCPGRRCGSALWHACARLHRAGLSCACWDGGWGGCLPPASCGNEWSQSGSHCPCGQARPPPPSPRVVLSPERMPCSRVRVGFMHRGRACRPVQYTSQTPGA